MTNSTRVGQDQATASRSAFHVALEQLSPGYFALVMATGIVAVGLHAVRLEGLSLTLLCIAAISYVVLWILFIWRAISHRAALLHDLRDPAKAFSFFTVVAGTGVLAVSLSQHGAVAVSTMLIGFATVLWFIFGYVLPWQVFMTRDGEPILTRTNGTWFVWAVASQSLAIGMTRVHPQFTDGNDWIGLLTVLTWSVGVALYAGIAILVLLRIIQFGITPREFDPSYWVAMGAIAIAVVAGTDIVGMQSSPIVDATRTIIASTLVIFWSFCVWLIPMLIGAGFWRHIGHRIPLTYTPMLWSMVFPLGMFALASINLGRVDQLPVVETIGHVMLVAAVLVWFVVFTAMLVRIANVLWRSFRMS